MDELALKTPTGILCPECFSRSRHRKAKLTRIEAGAVMCVGVIGGAVAGWGVAFELGVFTILIAFVYGILMGEMCLRMTSHKRGRKIELCAGWVIVVGALAGRMLIAAMPPSLGAFDSIKSLLIPSPMPAISIAISAMSAVSRIRYFD